jgi:hypothetical protein
MLFYDNQNQCLLFKGVEIAPNPILGYLQSEFRGAILSLHHDIDDEFSFKFSVDGFNFQLFFIAGQFRSGTLWLDQESDRSATWNDAEKHEQERAILHKELLTKTFGHVNFRNPRFEASPFFDDKTYQALILFQTAR